MFYEQEILDALQKQVSVVVICHNYRHAQHLATQFLQAHPPPEKPTQRYLIRYGAAHVRFVGWQSAEPSLYGSRELILLDPDAAPHYSCSSHTWNAYRRVREIAEYRNQTNAELARTKA